MSAKAAGQDGAMAYSLFCLFESASQYLRALYTLLYAPDTRAYSKIIMTESIQQFLFFKSLLNWKARLTIFVNRRNADYMKPVLMDIQIYKLRCKK